MIFDSAFLKKLEQLQYIAKRLRRGIKRGEHRTMEKGSSQEFLDYRPYMPGDDPRYIDWSIYQRLSKLVVKVFTAEQELPVHILLDVSASMGEHAKLEYAKKLAAALGYIAMVRQDQVGVTAFTGASYDSLPPARRQHDLFFKYLDRLKATGTTDLNSALEQYTRLKRRPGLAIILSDLLDNKGYENGLLALRFNRYEIILIQILHSSEITPDSLGNIRLRDIETSQWLRITATKRLLQLYTAAAESFFQEVEGFCLNHGIEYLRATTQVPFEDIVLRYLREGRYLQ